MIFQELKFMVWHIRGVFFFYLFIFYFYYWRDCKIYTVKYLNVVYGIYYV